MNWQKFLEILEIHCWLFGPYWKEWGGCLSTKMRRNMFVVSKWTVQAESNRIGEPPVPFTYLLVQKPPRRYGLSNQITTARKIGEVSGPVPLCFQLRLLLTVVEDTSAKQEFSKIAKPSDIPSDIEYFTTIFNSFTLQMGDKSACTASQLLNGGAWSSL